MIEDEEIPPEVTPGPHKKRRWLKRALIGALIAGVVFGGGASLYASWALGGSAKGSPVHLIISEGESTAQIANALASKHVIRSALIFRLVAGMRGVAKELKPGVYDTRTGLGVSAAIDLLRKGIPLAVEVFTIPEGETILQTAGIVGNKTHVTAKEFLAAVHRYADRPAIMPSNRPLNFEGFLFPKTYEITKKATADDVVKLMVDQFNKETADVDFRRAHALGVTPYQVIVVASLIEKEARRKDEQALVSSVIYNRIRRHKQLQIDATIQYVYIERDGHPKNPLETSDYRLDSPYNTYRIDGLPPGPIASPGLSAINAALAPAKTDYFFYRLCDPNHLALGHVFGHTIAERDRKYAHCRG